MQHFQSTNIKFRQNLEVKMLPHIVNQKVHKVHNQKIKPKTRPLIITVFATSISVEATPIDYIPPIVAKEGTLVARENAKEDTLVAQGARAPMTWPKPAEQ